MLKTMRRNVKTLKPILWIIVLMFIAAIFTIWGGAGRLGDANRGNTIASVGRDKISSDEYFQSLRQRLEAMKQQFSGLNANLIQQLNIPQQTLEQLIQQRLLLQTASGMGLRASDREVRERIVSYPVFQRDGAFIGFAEYKRVLEMNRLPIGDFERSLRQDILINKAVRILTAGVAVTEDEVWANYRKQNDTAKIEYLVSEAAKIETTEKPTEAEIEAHFNARAGAYKIPEKRTADYIFIRTDDAKKDVRVQDSEVEQYYKSNQAQFQEPEKVQVSRIWLPATAQDKAAVLAQAREVARRARGGEDFADLARKFSKDDKAANGGDWGLMDWKSLSAKETEAVGKLDKGAASEAVETDAGVAVLKVTDKQPALTRTLAETSAQIRTILEDEKARTLISERIQRLARVAIKEKSLDLAAQKEGLKISPTGALKQGDPLGDFDSAGAVSGALFRLKDKEITEPIFTYTGEALAQLRSVEAERPAKLDEVRGQVEQDILSDLKKTRAQAKLHDIRTALKDDWNSEALKNKLEYKTVESHKREQYLSLIGEKPEVDTLVFTMPLKQTSDLIEVEGGYAILRVLDRKEVTREDFEKNRATEKSTLLEQKRNKFLQSYMARAREEKKVRYNYDLFLRLNQDILSRYSGGE